jgi:hypothetical protein
MLRARKIGVRRAALLAAIAALTVLAGAGALAGATDALAYLLPVLLLLGALTLRLYPGACVLAAALAAGRRRRSRRSAGVAPRARAPRARLARGGALVGSAIAVRPPPGAAQPAAG